MCLKQPMTIVVGNRVNNVDGGNNRGWKPFQQESAATIAVGMCVDEIVFDEKYVLMKTMYFVNILMYKTTLDTT